jgi:pimeloyl-ACP methyl ester carboxylesterase
MGCWIPLTQLLSGRQPLPWDYVPLARYSGAKGNTDLPIVIGSGEHDAFAEFLPRIAAAMWAHGCTNLKTETVKGAAHYVAEEEPDAVAGLIERYAARTSPAKSY